MRILLAILLFSSLLNNQMIPIKRNQLWNELVTELKTQEEPLTEIQRFLKKHENEPELRVIDVNFLKSLDRIIKSSEIQVKKLKELRNQVGRNP